MYFPASLYFELISLIASITLFFQKGTPFYLKLFPPFLLITLILEIIGFEFAKNGQNNLALYNYSGILSFSFYLFYLRNIVHSPKAKRIIEHLLWIYPLLTIFNIYFIQKNAFHSMTFSLGCLLVVATCIYYFFELFRQPKYVNLLKEPSFWICSGLLFFFCCTFPLIGLTNYLYRISKAISRNFGSILTIVNFLLYSLFTIAFLCRLNFRSKSMK